MTTAKKPTTPAAPKATVTKKAPATKKAPPVTKPVIVPARIIDNKQVVAKAAAKEELLPRKRIEELAMQIAPLERLDSSVVDVLQEMADDFVESVTGFACDLAKHRKSTQVGIQDLHLALEHWGIKIPGSGLQFPQIKKPSLSDGHRLRLAAVRRDKAAIQAENQP